jgi:PadR family transcriptional regulator PadR
MQYLSPTTSLKVHGKSAVKSRCWDSNPEHSVLETDVSADWTTAGQCGWRDLNPQRPDPQSDASAKLLDRRGNPAYPLPYLIYGKGHKENRVIAGDVELLILKTLERNAEPMHGYAIARYIKQISNDVLRVEEGSLYPALQRLALKGWVKSEWGPFENNRRARYYNLTPDGRKRVKHEVADFERGLEAILRVVQPA